MRYKAVSAKEYSPTFGAWLRLERRRLDLTQSELADISSCALITIKKIESGQLRPSKSLALALARSLRIPPEEHAAFIQFARMGQPTTILPSGQAAPDWYEKRWRKTLPDPLTTLVGRDREIETIQHLLTGAEGREANRLITITGPGGVGKTSLAIEIANRLRDDFPQGIFFVDLSPLAEPDRVIATVLQTIGLKDEGSNQWQDTLISFLYNKHLLLVMDNFEHLLAAAPQVSSWLRACKHLQVLVTSREPLHLRGEKLFPLSPLSVPGQASFSHTSIISGSSALKLLVERLQEAKPDFTLTPENTLDACQVCIRLDGLPLAIELTAAQIRYLTLPEILSRLKGHLPLPTNGMRDLPDRQRTIAATIAWSYSLLEEAERVLFRRLSVFAGGFSLQAAEAVTSGRARNHSLLATDTLGWLGHLVEKSLVQTEERNGSTRYRFLETIREFAHERLVESGEEERIGNKHLDYFWNLAREGGKKVRGPEQDEWMKQLNLEMDNFRATIRWALATEAVEQGLELVSSLWVFWLIRGNWAEVKEWVLSLLRGQSDRPISLELRARACYTAAQMAFRLGDQSALTLFEESIAYAREIGPAGVDILAMALTTQVGATLFIEGNFKHARDVADEAIHIARASGDPWLIAVALGNLVTLLLNQGEYRQATPVVEESLKFSLETEDQTLIALCYTDLGHIFYKQGNYGAARSYLVKALGIFNTLEDLYDRIPTLLLFAEIALAENDANHARELFNECNHLWVDPGFHRGAYLIGLGRVRLLEGDQEEARALIEEGLRSARERNKPDALRGLLTLARLSILEGKHTEAQDLLHETLTLVRQFGSFEVIAECFELAATIGSAIEKPVEATYLLGSAEALRGLVGVPMFPSHQAEYDQVRAAVRTQLGDEKFNQCTEAGRSLPLEEVMNLAQVGLLLT
jgi:predicted ATPase/DNA-binding XRE family transcriptional regulator/Tfp pilus assembly protein PilF